MEIKVIRKYTYPTSQLGELWVDGAFFGYTLEDVNRAKKVYGETCIPASTYNVIVTYSNRFKVELPLLENVVGFAGVRIHGGNTDKDTHGCILLGSKIDLKTGKISNCGERVSTITKMIKENKKATLIIEDNTF
jgi:hypothetical protein